MINDPNVISVFMEKINGDISRVSQRVLLNIWQGDGDNKMNDKWDFYKDNAGEWRWTRTASNGRIVGASSQGYANRADCVANAQRNGYTGS